MMIWNKKSWMQNQKRQRRIMRWNWQLVKIGGRGGNWISKFIQSVDKGRTNLISANRWYCSNFDTLSSCPMVLIYEAKWIIWSVAWFQIVSLICQRQWQRRHTFIGILQWSIRNLVGIVVCCNHELWGNNNNNNKQHVTTNKWHVMTTSNDKHKKRQKNHDNNNVTQWMTICQNKHSTIWIR